MVIVSLLRLKSWTIVIKIPRPAITVIRILRRVVFFIVVSAVKIVIFHLTKPNLFLFDWLRFQIHFVSLIFITSDLTEQIYPYFMGQHIF